MKIGGIIEQRHLALYTIAALKDKPGSVAEVLSAFADASVNLAYIAETVDREGNANLSFCIDCDDKDRVDEIIRAETKVISKYIVKTENVAMLGIYGPHFREKPAIAVRLFKLLGESGINVLGISSSISTISCIIDVQKLEKAKQALLKYFQLP